MTGALHKGEYVEENNLTGSSWTVLPPEHVGHEMTVLGRIAHSSEESPHAYRSSMHLVECSCGARFRMGQTTIARGMKGSRNRWSQ